MLEAAQLLAASDIVALLFIEEGFYSEPGFGEQLLPKHRHVQFVHTFFRFGR